MTDDIDKSRSM